MRKYSEHEIAEIIRRYPDEPTARLAADLGRTPQAVSARASALGIGKSAAFMDSPASGRARPGHVRKGTVPWTPGELEELRRRFADEPSKDIARDLGRKYHSVTQMAYKLGLHKSEAFKASPASGRMAKGRPLPGSEATRFKPGQPGWNAGLRGLGVLKGNSGSFRKGHLPHNWCPVGTIRPTTEGYLRIKVEEPRTWEFVHLRTWIAANGPVPDGHMVSFADKNKNNCHISNLRLVSREDHIAGITYHDYPEDLKEALRALWKLQRRIRKHGKE